MRSLHFILDVVDEIKSPISDEVSELRSLNFFLDIVSEIKSPISRLKSRS